MSRLFENEIQINYIHFTKILIYVEFNINTTNFVIWIHKTLLKQCYITDEFHIYKLRGLHETVDICFQKYKATILCKTIQ